MMLEYPGEKHKLCLFFAYIMLIAKILTFPSIFMNVVSHITNLFKEVWANLPANVDNAQNSIFSNIRGIHFASFW